MIGFLSLCRYSCKGCTFPYPPLEVFLNKIFIFRYRNVVLGICSKTNNYVFRVRVGITESNYNSCCELIYAFYCLTTSLGICFYNNSKEFSPWFSRIIAYYHWLGPFSRALCERTGFCRVGFPGVSPLNCLAHFLSSVQQHFSPQIKIYFICSKDRLWPGTV